MKTDNNYWNFEVWKAFSKKLYNECLTVENIENNGTEEFYESVFKIDKGTSTEEALFPISYRHLIKLSKSSDKYVLPVEFEKKLPIKVTKTLPYQLKKADKKVWNLITGFDDMSITATKTQSFKAFIDAWNPVEHSSPEYYTLLKLIALGSKWKGVKLGLCSEPEGGKTSNYTIMGYISGDVGRITNPTIAKFEAMMYYNRVLLPDEVPNWEPKTIRDVESLMIAIADGSTEYTKHSKATDKRMEKMDVGSLSIVFGYNRPEDMKNGEKFFDEAWNNPGAIKSRYPQLLLKGRVTTKMPKINDAEASVIMEANFPIMATVAKNYTYFTQHLDKELHNYNRGIVSHLSGRHASNLHGVIDAIDAYSDDEMEFMNWCSLLNTCLDDYKQLVRGWKATRDDKPGAFDKYGDKI